MNKIKGAALSALTIILQISCSGPDDTDHLNKPSFCLTDSLANNIELVKVKKETVVNEIQLNGRVTFNEDKIVNVYPLVGGHVEDVKVALGDFVEKGDILAVIRSSEMADFSNQMISAQSNLITAQKNLEVAQEMFNSGLVTEQELVTRKNELNKAESELERIREILKIYGSQSKSIYMLKAPISGFIVDKKITENMEFRTENTDHLFTISDLKNIWVLANVYESDIEKIKEDYQVSIRTITYPDKVFVGKIDKVFNILDPVTKVLKVRVTLENSDFLLKPGMFAAVNVRYSEQESMVAVPSRAIIFDKSRHYLMVHKNHCEIETRQVDIYKTVNGTTYLKNGVDDGETIITSYHLLIYDELND